ncbi:unnamed protein product [Coccothraustes coccothraustes]
MRLEARLKGSTGRPGRSGLNAGSRRPLVLAPAALSAASSPPSIAQRFFGVGGDGVVVSFVRLCETNYGLGKEYLEMQMSYVANPACQPTCATL